MIPLESLHQVVEPIDHEEILDCYINLESKIEFTEYGHKGSQTGLQYWEGEDAFFSAVGKSRGQELECTVINPLFANTIFETVINKYQLKKTRLMWVYPYACYSMHEDYTPRVHIPLITNKNAYFVFKRGLIRNLEAGYVHYTDTRYNHTFMNCSAEKRLHLVGAVSSTWLDTHPHINNV